MGVTINEPKDQRVNDRPTHCFAGQRRRINTMQISQI